MDLRKCVVAGSMVAGLLHCAAAQAQSSAPVDPYPVPAAGWGGEAGKGLYATRWVEDWTALRAAGKAPRFKAMPLWGNATLTLNAETRLRYVNNDNAQLVPHNDFDQGLLRGILGADLRFNDNARVYGEIGRGEVWGNREAATASFKNVGSLQQLFVDVRGHAGDTLIGAIVGRQEFTDGPKQLLSIGDGSTLHRTWNGVRVYVHGPRWRLGVYDFRLTRLGRGGFDDEEVDHGERLRGLNASWIVSPDTYFDPFWIHSEKPGFRSGGLTGLDDRDTFGARLWGKHDKFRYDWTVAHQAGRYRDTQPIDTWALFAVQSVDLSSKGWKPRLISHIDIASGGGAYGTGTLRSFNPLYASSGYLGEAQFLTLSNLLMIAPGISVAPSAKWSGFVEYGFARRLDENDAVYAGSMRAYPNTQRVPGHEIGGLLRVAATWAPTPNFSLTFNYEHLDAGDVLQRAGQGSGSQGFVSATYRY